MKRILLLLFEFVVLTLPLAWIWLAYVNEPYDRLLFQILHPIYESTGAEHAGRGPVGHRFISYVPFAVLVAITPKLSLRRRLVGGGIGCAIILLSHLVMLVVSDAAFTVYGPGTDAVATIFPFLLLTDGLPLLIWFILARDFLRTTVPGLGEPPAG